jgi:DNA-binding LacI/PurR family transcriptional regulator
MADVAARAGVSVMTVSRVMNGFEGVADQTRRRVQRAVADLGYQADTAARVLAGGRSGTIGVVAVETDQFGPSQMLFGIDDAARRAGHLLTFVTLDRAGNDMGATLDRLRASRVEGVIVVAPVRRVVDAVVAVERDLPLVVVGGDPTIGIPTVTIDQHEGANRATTHLLDLGHATVAHVRGPRSWIDAAARARGWAEAIRDAGAPYDRPLIGDWTAPGGYAAGTRLAADPSVTAVFAANDQTALGVVRALHDHGRRVPQEVSVVGFDDTPESGYFVPALTTIRQDFAEVGRRCVELLRSVVDRSVSERHVVVPAELVVRESTAPRGDQRRARDRARRTAGFSG